MKIKIEDTSALPGWLQTHVTDGQLDLAAIPEPEDVSGLKSALQKERANASAYSRFGKPEDIEAKIAALEEKAKGSGKGAEDAQAKLDALKVQYEAQISERDDRLSQMMRANAGSALKAELAKAGFIPDAIEDIAASAMARLAFGDDGSPKVLTADGKPMIGSGPDHGATLTDLAAELAKTKSYAVADGGKGGGGKPPGSTGGTSGKSMTRAEFDALAPADRMNAVKGGATITD